MLPGRKLPQTGFLMTSHLTHINPAIGFANGNIVQQMADGSANCFFH